MRLKTLILVREGQETKAQFKRRYEDKAIEVGYQTMDIRSDRVTINF